jgi:hypothetical protein
MFFIRYRPDPSEPDCVYGIGAGPSLEGKSLDMNSREDGWRPKKAEGVVSKALSTPSGSGYYGVNPK